MLAHPRELTDFSAGLMLTVEAGSVEVWLPFPGLGQT